MGSNSKKLKKEQILDSSQDLNIVTDDIGLLYKKSNNVIAFPKKRTDLLNFAQCPSKYIFDILTPKDNCFEYIKDKNIEFDLKDIFNQKKMPTPTSSDNRVLLALIKNEKNGITNLNITELSKISGVHRTGINKCIERLESGLYLGNKIKKSNTIVYTKRKLIQTVDKNLYRVLLTYIEDKSYSLIDLDKLNIYLKLVHNKQVDTATDFLLYYVRLVTSSNKNPIKRLIIRELELTVFASYKFHRNEYENLLKKCLDGLKEIGYLEDYKFEKGNRGEQVTISYPIKNKRLILY
jgi:hypothetical protein